jgi:hypothetical protein
MRVYSVLIIVCFYSFANGQYYYNDIVANTLSNQQFKLIKQARIKTIKAISYEPSGEVTQGFNIEQAISSDFRKTVTTTSLQNNNSSTLTVTYENNRVKKSVDENHKVETTNTFTYNEKGLPTTITSNTTDTAVKITSNEVHIWNYNANNIPTLLLKIKNKVDTTFIEFVYDEKGNVGEERWKRKGRVFETYYYYYNDKNQVTDIVRFNTRAKQMLPDYLYEYDDKGRISKMTQVTNGGSNYLVWTYTYNDKGLKETEVCYNKQKQLVGSIEYGYLYQ